MIWMLDFQVRSDGVFKVHVFINFSGYKISSSFSILLFSIYIFFMNEGEWMQALR